MRRRQSGQTLIMFAITMTFMFLSLIALVGDSITLMVRYNQVNAEALLAAQAGASAVDENAFYQGVHRVDPNVASTRCHGVPLHGGSPQTHRVDCQPYAIDGIVVGETATVSWDVNLPIPLLPNATVRATRTGRAVFGGQQAAPGL